MPRLILGCLLVSLVPAISFAEPDQRRAATTAAPVSQVLTAAPDFLFGRPRGSVGLRAIWMNPRADSDLYSFLTKQLTLETNDFRAKGVALGLRLPGQFASRCISRTRVQQDGRELRGSGVYRCRRLTDSAAHTTVSDQRHRQSWSLRSCPRGRAVGQFAWIPAPVTPYIGAGAGLLRYNLEQTGDFVDSLDPELPIFTAQLLSDGWTTSTHVFGGVDVKVTRRVLLSAEVRYAWASAETSLDFVGFETDRPVRATGQRWHPALVLTQTSVVGEVMKIQLATFATALLLIGGPAERPGSLRTSTPGGCRGSAAGSFGKRSWRRLTP